jgi:hypothetical protein
MYSTAYVRRSSQQEYNHRVHEHSYDGVATTSGTQHMLYLSCGATPLLVIACRMVA